MILKQFGTSWQVSNLYLSKITPQNCTLYSTVQFPMDKILFFVAWGPTVLGRVPWSLVWWWSMHAFNHTRIYAHFVSSGHWWGWNKAEKEKFPERIVQVCLLIWSYFMNRWSLLKSELSRTFFFIFYFFIFISVFCLSGRLPSLHRVFLHYYTVILQRIRIIVGDAGFEPGTSAPEVWCAANKPPHLHKPRIKLLPGRGSCMGR